MKIVLNVNYSVPSLNKLFKMNHWNRHREKLRCQGALASALLDSAVNCSTQTISQEVVSTLSTASATLALYQATGKTKSASLLSKSKSKPKNKNKPE